VALPDARDLIFSPDGSAVAYLCWHQNVAAFTLNIAAPEGSGERELTRRDLFPDRIGDRQVYRRSSRRQCKRSERTGSLSDVSPASLARGIIPS
jgi:hypothetical protein